MVARVALAAMGVAPGFCHCPVVVVMVVRVLLVVRARPVMRPVTAQLAVGVVPVVLVAMAASCSVRAVRAVWVVLAALAVAVAAAIRARPAFIRVRVRAATVAMAVAAARVVLVVQVVTPARVESCCCSLPTGVMVWVVSAVPAVPLVRRVTAVLAPRVMR